MIKRRKKSGFTLLELMIVVIIIGILASLAIPRFIAATERARRGAATEMLAALRGAQMRYFAEYGAYATRQQGLTVLDIDMTSSTDWTVIPRSSGAGDDTEIIGRATHRTGPIYEIQVDGTIVLGQPFPAE